jgi:hypothetical protein
MDDPPFIMLVQPEHSGKLRARQGGTELRR